MVTNDEPTRILVVDDEEIALNNLKHVLKKEGYEVTASQSGPRALYLLEENMFDLVLTDLKMEKVGGMQILKRTRELYPDTEVIMITGYATVDSAIEAMKGGAYHYIAKPYKLDEVRKVVREALEKTRLKRENSRLREHLKAFQGDARIITDNPGMKKLLATAGQVATSDSNVVICGESGTGKELLAQFVHSCSNRRNGPLLSVNCGAFQEDLLANELFGHEKGAFTGAVEMKKGLVEMADGGTLFLDEITEMSPAMQVKLLRVIQEKEVMHLGGVSPIKVNVRFLAATNRNLQEEVKLGHFRQDLFFRINVVALHIPPLAERKDDLPLLIQHFIRKYGVLMHKEVRNIEPEVVDILLRYDFPGNVRELENIIERGVALASGDTIEVGHLPEDLRDASFHTFRRKSGGIPSLADQERAYIEWVLREHGDNKSLAAQVLGIDRVSLWRKIKKYELEG
ncbi:MAG: sigma-54-dependent Fis family transcriptional regulator [Deltaproteobacteria bacterium]|jgi:DNA-binding NtrC family response regulator|uniref:sigma-54-dependent transcriptional regulator n=1 Tax=Hydrosulfovibrio ferrireducens TaxID=2934181 RepID=UPI001220450D|nr:MAG: sigma-54-dependent Fis family transcriptional regulator [Deltaproteobacteria bacterium]